MNCSINTKLKIIKRYHHQGRLLDLGCGLGYFLNGVKEEGTFMPTGADISDQAINYIKNEFKLEAMYEKDLISYESSYFDIITQWHVLEHVYQLEERMKELKRLLSNSGTMFIAVPNSLSFDAKYYKKYWDGYDVPRHLYHFNPKTFSILMENFGFKVIKQKAMLFDAPYISMRSENHQKKKLGFIKGGLIGVISNIFGFFTGNYSTVLYIVKHK